MGVGQKEERENYNGAKETEVYRHSHAWEIWIVLSHYRWLYVVVSVPTFDKNYFNPGNIFVYLEIFKLIIVKQFFNKVGFKIMVK